MTGPARYAAIVLLPFALAACAAEPMITDSDVIRHATEPAYDYDERGQIQPTSCRGDRPSTYSGTPSACQRDVIFARQVANPADLVDPRQPGPAPAGPIGRAADAYVTGGAVISGVPSVPSFGASAPRVVVPATAAMPAADPYYPPPG